MLADNERQDNYGLVIFYNMHVPRAGSRSTFYFVSHFEYSMLKPIIRGSGLFTFLFSFSLADGYFHTLLYAFHNSISCNITIHTHTHAHVRLP
jgi:hypothetical protein